MHFGLGTIQKIDSLELRWPDGKVFKQKDIASNQVLTLKYNDSLTKNPIIISNSTIFENYNLASGAFSHQEVDFNDFQKEVLLPNKLSQIGPALAVGDVNNDGLDDYFVTACDFDGDGDQDLFVGGMMEQQKYPYPARSYLLENQKGKFTDITPLALQRIGMIRSAIWTDFDKDGDKDLMIVGEWMSIQIFENIKGKLTQYNAIRLLTGKDKKKDLD